METNPCDSWYLHRLVAGDNSEPYFFSGIRRDNQAIWVGQSNVWQPDTHGNNGFNNILYPNLQNGHPVDQNRKMEKSVASIRTPITAF